MKRILFLLAAPFVLCACTDAMHDTRAVSEYRAAWSNRTDTDCLKIDQLRASNPHLTAKFNRIQTEEN